MDNPPGICHLCMGGTKEGDWEDLNLAELSVHIRFASFSPIPLEGEVKLSKVFYIHRSGLIMSLWCSAIATLSGKHHRG